MTSGPVSKRRDEDPLMERADVGVTPPPGRRDWPPGTWDNRDFQYGAIRQGKVELSAEIGKREVVHLTQYGPRSLDPVPHQVKITTGREKLCTSCQRRNSARARGIG
jgi:hypothetical protein